MDLAAFFTDFQDHLAPKLDVYEQAIYLYVFRHSRLIGLDEVVLGFKSAREGIASSYRFKGTAINEGTCYCAPVTCGPCCDRVQQRTQRRT